ncbi:MAG: hypothetical protein IPM16_19825 [Chloroflexi bacterium]|nr:hypothetical protein [Chloroflexota bacterium]MBK9125352.1 hypothetical protein [Chloroflexota bacterium]
MASTKEKRNVLDDLVDGAREIFEALDRLLNPGKRPKPQPIPIPVRSNPPRHDPRRR